MTWIAEYYPSQVKVYRDSETGRRVPSVSLLTSQILDAPYLPHPTEPDQGVKELMEAGALCHEIMAVLVRSGPRLPTPEEVEAIIHTRLGGHPDTLSDARTYGAMCVSLRATVKRYHQFSPVSIKDTETTLAHATLGYEATFAGTPDAVAQVNRTQQAVALDWKFVFSGKPLNKATCVRPEHELAGQCYIMLLEESGHFSPHAPRPIARYFYVNELVETYVRTIKDSKERRALIHASRTLLTHRLETDLQCLDADTVKGGTYV